MPLVSIIIPCYNEEKTILILLDALLNQTYPARQMEVVVADGMSNDRTRENIASFSREHPELEIRVIDNVQREIPVALNLAIKEAKGEIVMRMDAHAFPARDYVERCVRGLEEGKGENVGGVWEIQPGGPGWQARSIAAAAAHPIGVGDAFYRFTTKAASVDTLPYGAYRRETLLRVGCYDETLLANEDYELNLRIRQSGGKVWLDPQIRCTYFSRSTFNALRRQYFRYGQWKLRMLRRYPETARARQVLPPLFAFSLPALLLLAPFWQLARILLPLELVVYCMILLYAGVTVAMRRKDISLVAGVPIAIAVMHLSWGYGFLSGFLRK